MLLIVDEDPAFLEEAATAFGPRRVWLAGSAEQARSLLGSIGGTVTAVLVNLELPGNDGVRFVEVLRESFPDLPVFGIGGSGQVPRGVKVLRKPVSSEWQREVDRAVKGSGFMTA